MPLFTKSLGGAAHAGALAPSSGPLIVGFTAAGAATGGGGGGPPPRRPPPPARPGGGAPCANTLFSLSAIRPSLFASRSTVMLLAAGELTNRSPLAAYTIMRGASNSAYTETVKPSGTLGSIPSGRGTGRPNFGCAGPMAGSALARGCGAVEFCCESSTAVGMTTAAATSHADFICLSSLEVIRPRPRERRREQIGRAHV